MCPRDEKFSNLNAYAFCSMYVILLGAPRVALWLTFEPGLSVFISVKPLGVYLLAESISKTIMSLIRCFCHCVLQ
ncbi:hypothetical protein Droror1_Dr00024453 [Drosera rotundifolia]